MVQARLYKVKDLSAIQEELSEEGVLFWTEASLLLPPGDVSLTTGRLQFSSPVCNVTVMLCSDVRLIMTKGNDKVRSRKRDGIISFVHQVSLSKESLILLL